jgi:hypothetical protein
MRRHPVAGQRNQAAGRHRRTVQPPGAQFAYRRQALQGAGHLSRAEPGRRGAKSFQLRHPFPFGHHQQGVEEAAKPVAGQPVQRRPQPLGGRSPNLGDHAGQSRHPREQHLVLHAPRSRPVEQRPRPLVGQPRPRLHETAQLLDMLCEIGVPVLPADLPLVLVDGHGARAVILHARRVADPELFGHEDHHRPRHVNRVGHERAQETDSAQLDGETERRGVPSALLTAGLVSVVQPEEPLQLLPGRRAQ